MVAQVFCFDVMDIQGEKVEIGQIDSDITTRWQALRVFHCGIILNWCEMRSKWERLLLEEKKKNMKKQEIKVKFTLKNCMGMINEGLIMKRSLWSLDIIQLWFKYA